VSQPISPPSPDWVSSVPEWTGTPAWRPPAPVGPPAPAAAPSGSRSLLVLGLVGLAGLAAGAVGAAFLVTAVFVGSAEAIGEGIGRGMAAEEQQYYSSMSEEEFGWSALPPLDPEDVEPPVAPVPGPDPVLDAYAQGCFEGDYQSCDDLFYESPPMSAYEEYGATCGGRVKAGAAMTCTDLE
jgi:hypothetical protein